MPEPVPRLRASATRGRVDGAGRARLEVVGGGGDAGRGGCAPVGRSTATVLAGVRRPRVARRRRRERFSPRPSRRRRARASRSRRRGRRLVAEDVRQDDLPERSDGDRCPEFAGPESLAVEPGFDPGRVVVPANLRNVLSVPAPARRLRGLRGWPRVPPEAAPRRAGAVSGKRRRDRLVGRRVVPRAPHRKWTRRFARLTARRGDGRGPIPARAEPRKRTHVAMQLSPHKSPISATWRPFWTTRVPLSVPATLLETPNDARRRKDGRNAASAMRSGQLRAKVVDLPIFLLIFLAGLDVEFERNVKTPLPSTFLGLLAKIKCSAHPCRKVDL